MASAGALLVFLVAVVGAVFAFRGVYIHRRNIQFTGLLFGAFLGGLLGRLLVSEGGGVGFFTVVGAIGGWWIAPRIEMAVVVSGGFLTANLLAAVLLEMNPTDALTILIGVGGAVIAWRAYLLVIVVYTSTVGAALLALPTIAGQAESVFHYSVLIQRYQMVFLWLVIAGGIGQLALLGQGYLPRYLKHEEETGNIVRDPAYDPEQEEPYPYSLRNMFERDQQRRYAALAFVLVGVGTALVVGSWWGLFVGGGIAAAVTWTYYEGSEDSDPDAHERQSTAEDRVHQILDETNSTEQWEERWEILWPKAHVFGNLLGVFIGRTVIGVFVTWVHVMIFTLAIAIYYDSVKTHIVRGEVK